MLTEIASTLTSTLLPQGDILDELQHLWQEGLESGGGRALDMEEIKREARLWVSMHENDPNRPRFPDLIEMWATIAADNPTKADQTLDIINHRLEWLAANKNLGTLRTDIAEGLHLFHVQRHVVFYRVFPDNGVQLVRAIPWSERMTTILQNS